MPWKLNFEIGPLKEPTYTGIAHMTACLADEMLGDKAEVSFCYGRTEIPRVVVEDLVLRRSGELLEWFVSKTALRQNPTTIQGMQAVLYSNRKVARRSYDFEYQIVYDLSTLLTPDFHNRDTIKYHALTPFDDLRSNDISFCISQATKTDIMSYFPEIDQNNLKVIPLSGNSESRSFNDDVIEGLIVVLGTIEPRKNVEAILKMLGRHPRLTKEYKSMFLGRFGWGESLVEVLTRNKCLEIFQAGAIQAPGFVSEAVKQELISRAELLIYPSLFEGFGLPVLEALSNGVACLTTNTSSLPEAGGQMVTYFDPFKPDDFGVQFMEAIYSTREQGENGRRLRMEWAKQFSWSDTYNALKSSIGKNIIESQF